MNCIFPFCTSSLGSVREPRSLDKPPGLTSFENFYKLDEQIGKGGFAVVKIAYSLQNDSKVAVKILKSKENPLDVEAFEREYRLLKSLNHPNIVTVHGFHHDSEKICMVLEYMEGGELFDRIVEKKVYTEGMARHAFQMMLEAVGHIHSHNIIHRDLKPENLLLSSKEDDSTLKVCDFGLARELNDEEELISRAGTPDYIAPEIVQSRPLGKPVDMWAAGVILFILLGGYSPFHKREKAIMFHRISTAHYTFHPARWAHISDEAKDLIKKLLQVNEESRLTVQEALSHPWMQEMDGVVLERDLTGNLSQLRQFNAMRKLRASVHVIIMANRMKKLGQSTKEDSVDEAKQDASRI
ncbi:serine/threonine-protein kinase [archaeon]|nr:MAG: serine/threonine-protein kinase [archaeon]